MERAVTVLPEPLSPTRPKMEFSLSSRETPLTALTIPSLVGKRVCRSLISSSVWDLRRFRLPISGARAHLSLCPGRSG